jgi:UDP-4-amino-4,6-dideoxy-N-acetyl-beta-L-altrosamine transaminase
MNFLPYGRQTIDEDDVAAVLAVLRSDFLTCGPEVEAFEREFAAMVGAKHAVAVCNATAALHLAMLAAGIGPGDRVITSPNTFLASANCAAFVGAIPDFADIESVSYNLDPVSLEANWKPDTKAVVAVDYAGQPADLPAIAQLARKRGALVVEDACHAAGGSFIRDNKVWKLGGHPWADITVFSFHPVKTMTTGEGGMFVTNDDEFARRAQLLRTHGMERDQSRFVGCEVGPWSYEMQQLGYNYRITDLQCALGRSQLRKIPVFMKRRQEIVGRYNKAFGGLPHVRIPGLRHSPPLEGESRGSSRQGGAQLTSWHLYTLQFDFPALGKTRTQFMTELREKGIGSQVLYIPVYLQPWYRQMYGYAPGKCPNAESFYAQALSLPLYPAMTDADVDRVINSVCCELD